MRYKYLIIPLFASFIVISSAQSRYHPVKYVYDGDTILINGGEKVRYLGIDAPELEHSGGDSEFMALTSRDFNHRLVGGKRVRLEFDCEKRDRHGRLLAYVFLENDEMVNELLIKSGLARIMIKPPNLKYLNLLLGYQRRAMSKK
ncbi:MAG: thermonuclease family protein [Deltaproteobacteria bacterium]|nr:thermonuclease family protein [Deltaproteobacteria bacterium]